MKIRSSHLRIWVSAIMLVTVLAGFLAFDAALGQTSPINLQATAAYDGYFKYGEWLPVWVQLENSGPDLDVEVQIRIPGSPSTSVYAVETSLPTGSRKRFPIYVLPNNFSHSLVVWVMSDGKELVSQEISVMPEPNITYLLGIVAEERGALALAQSASLPGMKRSIVAVDFPVGDMPERAEGLISFDALVLNDIDTSSLTPEQKTALESWVRQGGRLIIGGGAGALRTVGGLPGSLLPLDPQEQVEVDDLESLSEYAETEAVQVPGPFVAAVGEVNDSAILAGDADLPLVAEKAVGNGFVDYVALDLTISPFNAWTGTTPFWERLLSPTAAYPDWLPPDISARQMMLNQMGYALTNLPSLDLPSIRGLAVVLGIYIVLVGPVNYLLLRWRKRLHWAWVTIPLVTIAFAAGAFSLGYLMRGNDLLLNKISIVEVQPGGVASITNYFGLFSPAQQAYEIEVNDTGLLSPVNPGYDPWGSGSYATGGEVVFIQGQTGRMRGLTVNQWSMQAFMTEGTWTDLGEITSDLSLEDQAITGVVHNNTSQTIKDAVLVIGNQFKRLGDLEPGAEVDVQMDLPELSQPDFGPPLSYRLFEEQFNQPMPNGVPRELQLKQSIIDGVFQWGGAYWPVSSSKVSMRTSTTSNSVLMIGWMDTTPTNVSVSGREPMVQTTALMFTYFPYRFPEAGTVNLPAGIISPRLVQLPAEGGTCGTMGTPAVYLARGEAVFEFNLPESLKDLQVEKLTLSMTTDGGWNTAPATAFFDWDQNDWMELENPTFGLTTLANPDPYLDDSGLVRLRLSSGNGMMGSCFYIGIGLQGTR